ncbi:hypothetical protein PHSC3_001785 [Chlamydiales bacterium STE3]|nr:hypothetical protein PHSC3_001785 [Chlamydiales bacterium STE3]
MMHPTIKYFLSIALFLMLPCWGDIKVGHLNQNHDQGIWLDQNISMPLTHKWQLILHAGQRFGDDHRRLWFSRQWAILQYDLTENLKSFFCVGDESIFKNFSIGPGYSEVGAIQSNSRGNFHWSYSHRPSIVAFMSHAWKGWELQQRMAGEYLHFATKHYRNHAYYRHRAVLTSPWEWSSLRLNPFLSNEWFLRAENRKTQNGQRKVIQSGPFYENRLRMGFTMNLNRHFSPQFWWQLRLNKQAPGNHPLWRKTYQIGLTLNMNF